MIIVCVLKMAHAALTIAEDLQGAPKKLAPFLYALTLPNIANFQNYFTPRIRRKFVIILSLKIPTHFKCVATLLKATIFCAL